MKLRISIWPVLGVMIFAQLGCEVPTKLKCPPITAAPTLTTSSLVNRLIDDGAKLDGLHNYQSLVLTADDYRQMKAYCLDHPDPSSFVVLMLLRERSPADYQSLSPNIRTVILCRALRHLLTLGDFGHLPQSLHPQEQRGGAAMQALLEGGGEEILQLLYWELDDRLPVMFFGSSDSTAAIRYRYRHCDFAEWACRLVLNEPYLLRDDLNERDAAIAALKSRLLREGYLKSATPIGL